MEDIPVPVDHATIIKLLAEFGVDLADTRYYSNQTEKIIGTREGFYTKPFHDYGTGIRILHAGREGYLGTNDYEELGFRASQLARRLKRIGDGETQYVQSPPVKSSVDVSHENLINREYGGEPGEFHRSFASLMEEHENITFRYELENSLIHKEYRSTDGVYVRMRYLLSYFTLRLRIREQGRKYSLYKALGGVKSENLRWESIQATVETMVSELQDMIRARPIRPGIYDSLLSNDLAWTLIHETIGHGAEADGVIKNQSFLSKMMGQPIASYLLTVTDDSQIKSGGWAEFDDEGTKATGTLIVEDGIFTQFLHTRRTAAILGSAPTGNARTPSYLSPPISRQTNLYIQPQDMSDEELIEDLGNGLFLVSANGANVSLTTGDFHIRPQSAYLVKNGELAEPVLVSGITGSSISTLRSISGIGSKLEETPTFCYKNGTNLPVGMISPKMNVKMLEVY